MAFPGKAPGACRVCNTPVPEPIQKLQTRHEFGRGEYVHPLCLSPDLLRNERVRAFAHAMLLDTTNRMQGCLAALPPLTEKIRRAQGTIQVLTSALLPPSAQETGAQPAAPRPMAFSPVQQAGQQAGQLFACRVCRAAVSSADQVEQGRFGIGQSYVHKPCLTPELVQGDPQMQKFAQWALADLTQRLLYDTEKSKTLSTDIHGCQQVIAHLSNVSFTQRSSSPASEYDNDKVLEGLDGSTPPPPANTDGTDD